MSAFDDLTLGEVEEIESVALGGKQMGDDSVNPMSLAGGVMWITQRRDNPSLTWDQFKSQTTMGNIKAFSELMKDEESDPTSVRTGLAN
jgi:hypothetical protein